MVTISGGDLHTNTIKPYALRCYILDSITCFNYFVVNGKLLVFSVAKLSVKLSKSGVKVTIDILSLKVVNLE
jgi:hypothetical protein